jgi:hypothetical protein
MARFENDDIVLVRTDDGMGVTESIMFSWSIKNFGFGTTTFYYDQGNLFCDSETMSKDEIKKLLCRFVDDAEFID